MPGYAWLRRGSSSDAGPSAAASPIMTYRLADYTEIFSLYLNAVQTAVRCSEERARMQADNGLVDVAPGGAPRDLLKSA